MIKQTITAALAVLALGAGLSIAEAMPVGAGPSMSAVAAQPGIEKAKEVIHTTIIKHGNKTITKKVIIRR